MKKALIVSLNFNPGHVSHLIASYRQCEELGFDSLFYVNRAFEPYIPSGFKVFVYGKDSAPQVDIALIVFPSQHNLRLIRFLNWHGAKVLYIFHEPLAPMSEYKKAGFSNLYLIRLWLINQVNALTARWSSAILLPSKKAIELYRANSLYKNSRYYYLPLLYDDETSFDTSIRERKYFSYIGTIAADHSFGEYLEFIEWAIMENRLPGLSFLIATRSDYDLPKTLLESHRVTTYLGKPLSNSAINECYASSYVVWNAYSRTTQSGVLAKSFMFGTPAIILRKNLSEFTDNGKNVVAIDDKRSFEQIESAINSILRDFDQYSENARKRFMNSFYYCNYNDLLKQIIASL